MLSGSMVAHAHSYSRFVSTSLQMTRDTARQLGRLPTTSPVTFHVCGEHSARWGSAFGALVERYATTMSLTPPHVIDAPCADVRSVASSRAAMWRFVLSDTASARLEPGITRVYTHARYDLQKWRVQQDSLFMTILPP